MDALFRQQAECHRHEQPRKSKKHGKRRFILFEMWPLTVSPPSCTVSQHQLPTWILSWPLMSKLTQHVFLAHSGCAALLYGSSRSQCSVCCCSMILHVYAGKTDDLQQLQWLQNSVHRRRVWRQQDPGT